ncbi:N-6 DNA methylase [Methanolacinia petrolearia]|uniref:N-6 DNA methylase n=1 Tax=Methanolacinia petrolearia TaxID=54120 RepID=UPI003BACC704
MYESEHQTRENRIDPKLRVAGWKIVAYDNNKDLSQYDRCAIEEYPTSNGPADYALCVNGSIIAVVEAKKVSLGPQDVLLQAERYARGISGGPYNFDGLHVPFLYSTNGEVIWHHDVRHHLNRSRQISGFHTPDALIEMLYFDTNDSIGRFFDVPDNSLTRYYQQDACNAIGEAISDRKRTMLVAMATGTGKTYTMVNLIYRLMKAGAAIVVPDNVLFADQAGEVFKVLCEDCNLHTVLRLPDGTFTPYSPGTKTNVIFFTKGGMTEETWVYDCRTNIPKITKKDRPLTKEHFAEFEKCFGDNPDDFSGRDEKDSESDRWRRFHISELKERDYKIDSLKWLRDDSLESGEDLPLPDELEAAVAELNAILDLMGNGYAGKE